LNRTSQAAAGQRKALPKSPRSVRLVEEPYPEESDVIIITAGNRAFCLSKFTGESYDVNLGDAGNPPSCECLGFQRWGHRGPCKHVIGLSARVKAGRPCRTSFSARYLSRAPWGSFH
jgi:hypothetical protein